MSKDSNRALCAFALALALSAPPCAAQDLVSAPRGRAGLVLDLSAGPAIGLDRPLRGGAVALGVGASRSGLSAALRAGVTYDASLSAFIADAGLALGLGDGLRLLVGGELPLDSPALASGGARWPLAAAPWPSRFALAAPIARLASGGGPRPSIAVEAELSYSAYRVEGAAAPPAEAAGLAGFSAGFRALVALRLSWTSPPP